MAFVGVSAAFLLVLSVVVQASESCDECPPFWTRYGDNCYRFFGALKTWEEAESHCQEFFARYSQGHLASVRNQEENKFLQQYWNSSIVRRDDGIIPQVWIGLNDKQTEGTFVLSTNGEPASFTTFFGGQPDNAHNEDCVEIVMWHNRIAWNDRPCDNRSPYICQL